MEIKMIKTLLWYMIGDKCIDIMFDGWIKNLNIPGEKYIARYGEFSPGDIVLIDFKDDRSVIAEFICYAQGGIVVNVCLEPYISIRSEKYPWDEITEITQIYEEDMLTDEEFNALLENQEEDEEEEL